MKEGSNIHYVSCANIDRRKWDDCIDASPNGLVYAYSFYLDTAAVQWDALVQGDYECVMPLPWRRKWGVYYLYQPYFVAQLGIFGNSIDAATVTAFLKAIPKKFRYWDFALNHSNFFAVENFEMQGRMNYVLDLAPEYAAHYSAYRENTRRNLKKAAAHKCRMTQQVSPRTVIDVAKQFGADNKIGEDDYARFETLFHTLKEKGKARVYAIESDRGDLLSSAVFFYSRNRAYYLLVGNHPNGRTYGASHALIDGFICDHAGQNMLLDFEGSDLRNLAFFYASFGAREERYPAIKKNDLPFFMKWLKK